MSARLYCIVFLTLSWIVWGCANITAPTGGKRDKVPPRLVSVDPPDSQKNVRPNRIELHFDKYIVVSDAAKEVQLSPILPIAPSVTGLYKHVVVKIVDSLLEANTTYRLSFGSAIKDLHEGNVFGKYTYTFSTGSYFDSLQLHGTITDAQTGMPGEDGAIVELYYARDGDSAVVRHKPKYVTRPDASGNFTFKGLPKREFRIYALKDPNDNLIYDGPAGGEKIGFINRTVTPGDTTMPPINIKVFAETIDSVTKKALDTNANKKAIAKAAKSKAVQKAITYSLNVDTTRVEKRTFDIKGPVKVTFSRLPSFNYDKITLAYDSMGMQPKVPVSCSIDSAKLTLNIRPPAWRENTVYTLRLAKGFAKDSAGADVDPSRYTFRTMAGEDDYGTIIMHVPGKYYGSMYLFRAMADGDSIYQQPINDTTIVLRLLKPAKYTFRIIVDKNRDGKWNTGDLFGKVQPEDVIPYKEVINVRAGFEYDQDFEPKPSPKEIPRDNNPGKGDIPKDKNPNPR